MDPDICSSKVVEIDSADASSWLDDPLLGSSCFYQDKDHMHHCIEGPDWSYSVADQEVTDIEPDSERHLPAVITSLYLSDYFLNASVV